MFCFLKILGWIGIISLVIWKICWYVGYRYAANHKRSEYAPMKWSMVKRLYFVNPDRFEYEACGDGEMRVLFYKIYDYKRIPIMLSFYGYQKLRFHYLKSLIIEKKKNRNKTLALVIEFAQKDINKLKEKAEKEQSIGKNILLEILEGAEKEK